MPHVGLSLNDQINYSRKHKKDLLYETDHKCNIILFILQ